MANKIKKILFVSKDPGGVNSLIPIIKECERKKSKIEFHVISHRLSAYRYKEENIKTIMLDKFNYNSSKKKAVSNIIEFYQPHLIITGTSRPYDFDPITPEQIFIEISKQKKIKSICILDYWGDYLERFSSPNGKFNSSYVADKICALDQESKMSLLDIGVKNENIEITHNPYFDEVFNKTTNIKIQQFSDKEIFNVLFISQPLLESKKNYFQGFSQTDMFYNLIIFLTEWKPNAFVNLQVWLHPKEDKIKWSKIINDTKTNLIHIYIGESRNNNLFEWADFLVSGFSTIMYHALYYLLPVISMQIGLNKKDQLVTNQLGLSIPVFTKDELKILSNNFDIHKQSIELKKKKENLISKSIFFSNGLATKKIVSLINKITPYEG